MLAIEAGLVMVGVNSTGFAPLVDAGKLRLLATFAGKRSPRWPGVPTLKELGFPIVATSPYGIGGPRGLPPAIVDDAARRLPQGHVRPGLHQRDRQSTTRSSTTSDRPNTAPWLREQYAREKLVVERMGLSRSGG